MRKIILLFLFSCWMVFSSSAQEESEPKSIPISISYFGQSAIHPGIKVGTAFKLKSWSASKGEKVKLRDLVVQPQFAIYTRVGYNTNYYFLTDLGYRMQTQDKRFYMIFSGGLGYLMQSEHLGFSVDLGSGDHTNKNREFRGYFIPTVSYELGGNIKPKLGWFTKVAMGRQFSGAKENSSVLFLDVGVKIKLKM